MEDYIRNERELTVIPAQIVSGHVVGMVEPEFRANRDQFVRPPGNSNRMFGILRRKSSTASYLSFIYSFRTVKNVFPANRNIV